MAGPDGASGTQRDVYFGPEHGVAETPIIARTGLAGAGLPGPLVVEEYDVTTVVPPGCAAWLDEWSNIVIDVE
jgi:N-methylhydantoinase A